MQSKIVKQITYYHKRTQYSVILSLIVISSVNIRAISCSKDIFHGSTKALERIIAVQNDITDAVQEYVASLERRILLANRYLEDYQNNLKLKTEKKFGEREEKIAIQVQGSAEITLSQKESILFNPLKMFKLIRSLASTLPDFEKELHKDHEKRFLRTLENKRKGVVVPQQKDLDAVTEGLIRVQDAYDLDVFSFANGDFEGLLTNTSLNAADCFILGSYCLESNIFTRAIEWLERSYYLVQNEFDNSSSLQAVWQRLHEAILRHNAALKSPLQKNPYVYNEILDPRPHTVDAWRRKKRRRKILDKPKYQLYMTEASFTDLTNFAALCRGEQLQRPSLLKTLTCWLDRRSPYSILTPLQVELLHKQPQVLQIYNIIPNKLSHEIVKSAQQSSLSRSKVHEKNNEIHKVVSASRTSSSTWVHDFNVLQQLSEIYSRVQALLGLDLQSPGACENFQVSGYNVCGHYNPHLDNILTSEIAPGMEKGEIEKGDRLATLMFYLSDVPRGGFSVFPRIGIVAKPVKGSALFWFNTKINGEVDPLSLHGGCPVIFGNKWIANQWIRANSQMFVRKCYKKDWNSKVYDEWNKNSH